MIFTIETSEDFIEW